LPHLSSEKKSGAAVVDSVFVAANRSRSGGELVLSEEDAIRQLPCSGELNRAPLWEQGRDVISA